MHYIYPNYEYHVFVHVPLFIKGIFTHFVLLQYFWRYLVTSNLFSSLVSISSNIKLAQKSTPPYYLDVDNPFYRFLVSYIAFIICIIMLSQILFPCSFLELKQSCLIEFVDNRHVVFFPGVLQFTFFIIQPAGTFKLSSKNLILLLEWSKSPCRRAELTKRNLG